jgi:hypothetical protein
MLKKWLASLGHETSDHKLLCFNWSIIAESLIEPRSVTICRLLGVIGSAPWLPRTAVTGTGLLRLVRLRGLLFTDARRLEHPSSWKNTLP